MSITVTCPDCQQPWAVVPGIAKAHPGRRSEPVMVTVPDEDVYGRRHGMVTRPSSHWISNGPSASLVHMLSADGMETIYAWSCLCGKGLEYRTPALETVACQHGSKTGNGCAVNAIRVNPPADLYVNARYGGACPCCGHQGTHTIRKDRQGHVPACLGGAS